LPTPDNKIIVSIIGGYGRRYIDEAVGERETPYHHPSIGNV